MFDAVTLGSYVPGHSPLHRLDPRTKLLAVLLFSVGIFFLRAWYELTLAAAFTALAVAASRLSLRFLWRGLRPVVGFLLFALALNAVLTEGEPLYRLGPLTLTREGLVHGGVVLVRLMLLVVVASLMTYTTTPIALTDGLERLLRPFSRVGVPAAELALMMTIALRFIPTLIEEAQRIRRAQEARGARFVGGTPLAQVQAALPLLVPLFVAAFRRADELAVAMEARGYRGGRGRTRMKELRLGSLDAAAGAVVAAFAVAIVALRWAYR